MPPSPDASPDPFADAVQLVRTAPGLRRRLEVARAWGVRPSQLLDWDDDDLALALALHEVEADACPGCGGSLSVTATKEGEDRFVPGPPLRCHYCTARSQAAHMHKTDYHPGAVLYTVRDRALQPDHEHHTTGDTGEAGHAEEGSSTIEDQAAPAD